MSTYAFTPDPWTVQEDPDANGVFIIRQIERHEAELEHLADTAATDEEINRFYDAQNDLRAANQRLIEAAPVMIKALRAAFLHSCERSGTRCKWTRADQIIHEQLKAALAATELAPSEVSR